MNVFANKVVSFPLLYIYMENCHVHIHMYDNRTVRTFEKNTARSESAANEALKCPRWYSSKQQQLKNTYIIYKNCSTKSQSFVYIENVM